MKNSQAADISKDPSSAVGKSPLPNLEPGSGQEGTFKGSSPSMKDALLGAESACGLDCRVPTHREDSEVGLPQAFL